MKAYKGIIKDWCIREYRETGIPVVCGTLRSPSEFSPFYDGASIRTSEIVNINWLTGDLETRYSMYMLDMSSRRRYSGED